MRFYPGSGQLRLDPERYFPGYYCRYMLKDHDQNLWIATSKGLLRQDASRSYIRQVAIPEDIVDKHPGLFIDDICVCGNNIYVGARKNGGLLEYDKRQL
ncbi:MAG: hypothetical protein JST39_17405, partial [Bacteroidetes bacterium]|nr:hypothetical protein [Bacteroidota bacterium]